MEKHEGFMKALKCRECGREYPLAATHVCEFDFGPLEVAYDYDRIKKHLTRAAIESRPQTMWRYRELLPVAHDPTVGRQVGFTPLVKADRLAERLVQHGAGGTDERLPFKVFLVTRLLADKHHARPLRPRAEHHLPIKSLLITSRTGMKSRSSCGTQYPRSRRMTSSRTTRSRSPSRRQLD